ncbi:hypothetical protein V8F06_002768 [Rhypophila decipiens]
MDDQKRQSGARTPGLANPTNPAAAEAEIPFVIVTRPTQAEIVPVELIGIAVDYDPAAVCSRPGSSNRNDDVDEVVNAESNGTNPSEVTTITELARPQASEFGWFSATPPSTSPALTTSRVKLDTNLSVPHRTRTINLVLDGDLSIADSDDSLQPPTVRRGPTIRHDRLQHSETMASTRMAMDPMDQQRRSFEYRMAIRKGQVAITYSSLFLLFSLVTFGCFATTEILHLVGVIPDLEQQIGIIAGAILSGIATIIAAFLIPYTVKKHRKNRESSEDAAPNSWIELQHREKPLPPLPSLEKNAADDKDPKVIALRNKFVQDTDRLWGYLWTVEELLLQAHGGDRDAIPECMVVHDILAQAGPQSTTTGVVAESSSTPLRLRDRFSPIRIFSNSNGRSERNEPDPEAAPQALNIVKKPTPKHAAQDSISKDVLVATTDSAEAAIPRSETTTSILAELCDAVTEHYSPLNRVLTGEANTSRRSSRDQSPAAGNNSIGQRRWSHRGYANLEDVPETEADPYDTENYRRKGKGRAE